MDKANKAWTGEDRIQEMKTLIIIQHADSPGTHVERVFDTSSEAYNDQKFYEQHGFETSYVGYDVLRDVYAYNVIDYYEGI